MLAVLLLMMVLQIIDNFCSKHLDFEYKSMIFGIAFVFSSLVTCQMYASRVIRICRYILYLGLVVVTTIASQANFGNPRADFLVWNIFTTCILAFGLDQLSTAYGLRFWEDYF